MSHVNLYTHIYVSYMSLFIYIYNIDIYRYIYFCSKSFVKNENIRELIKKKKIKLNKGIFTMKTVRKLNYFLIKILSDYPELGIDFFVTKSLLVRNILLRLSLI